MTPSHVALGIVVSLIGIAFAWAAGAVALVMLPIAVVGGSELTRGILNGRFGWCGNEKQNSTMEQE